jgi:hypothetical protein
VWKIIIRFIIGGLVVSIFALLSDMLKPKNFAGLFGAAPSVALATISLTVIKDGRSYAATETRSMMIGALAFPGVCMFCEPRHAAGSLWADWIASPMGRAAPLFTRALVWKDFGGHLVLRLDGGDEIYFDRGARNNLKVSFGPVFRF